jgi:hypothetical protein
MPQSGRIGSGRPISVVEGCRIRLRPAFRDREKQRHFIHVFQRGINRDGLEILVLLTLHVEQLGEYIDVSCVIVNDESDS